MDTVATIEIEYLVKELKYQLVLLESFGTGSVAPGYVDQYLRCKLLLNTIEMYKVSQFMSVNKHKGHGLSKNTYIMKHCPFEANTDDMAHATWGMIATNAKSEIHARISIINDIMKKTYSGCDSSYNIEFDRIFDECHSVGRYAATDPPIGKWNYYRTKDMVILACSSFGIDKDFIIAHYEVCDNITASCCGLYYIAFVARFYVCNSNTIVVRS
jgi:hypothetical protein